MNHATETFLKLLKVLDETPRDDILYAPLRRFLQSWFKQYEALLHRELCAIGASPECSFESRAFPYMVRALQLWLGDSLPDVTRALLDATHKLVCDARFTHIGLLELP